MTQRRTNNSVVFLTLGVCIGLMLAGSSAPLVFAHSATTRSYEITDEVEFSDDIDNIPDGFAADDGHPRAADDLSDLEWSVRFALYRLLLASDLPAAHGPGTLDLSTRGFAGPLASVERRTTVNHTFGILAPHRPRSSLDTVPTV